MDSTQQSPAILSLCPGMLGLERGLDRAFARLNWPKPRTVAYVEIEAFIIWNLVKKMEQGVLAPAPIWSNLKTFNWEIFRGKIDIITGGYPCQPFSIAGNTKGEADHRHLFQFIEKGIDIIRPEACWFENVPNHLNIGYESVRRKLQDLGYHVEEGIYSAEEVGAPHRRERMFILAIMGDSKGIHVQRCKLRSGQVESRRASNDTALEHSNIIGFDNEQKGFDKTCQDKIGNISLSITERSAEQCRIIESGSGDKLANSDGSRGGENIQSGELWTSGIKQPSINSRTREKREIKQKHRWPARPNEKQYEWEPRRTEPKVDYGLNGYNFREDLLRMAGNGVVEQTAEIAFIDLLRKHKLRNP